jgi:hypothetical protein
LLSLLLSLAVGLAPEAGPPQGLLCLPRWYTGSVGSVADAGWGLVLPDAGFVPWYLPNTTDAGEVDEDDASPRADLSSLFETPYVPGPILPIDASDAGAIHEPGRARVMQMFASTYGESEQQVYKQLGRVRFFGTRYRFHSLAAPALERVIHRLESAVAEQPALLRFLRPIGGTWQWRRIARSRQLSAHAFGIAIDLNVALGHYWRWQRPKLPLKWKNRVPQAIVDAFEAEGFIWGGRWQHYDTMHFEYRPELFAPECLETPAQRVQ